MNAPYKLLIVDDELDVESLFTQKFRRRIRSNELSLQFAHNGLEALDKLSRDPDIQVVFTDINMPEMDGLTLLKEIKNLGYPVRVVVISAYGDLDNIRTAMNSGAFDFVTKPVDMTDLETTLDKTLAEVNTHLEAKEAKEHLKVSEVAREKAEQSKKFKEQFLANMSHEIRTPMNAVVGMTNLLLKTNLDEVQTKYLNAIKQSSDNLLVIINDILDLSKIEAGHMEFEKTEFLVEKLIGGAVNTLSFKAADKSLQLVTQINDDVPAVLVGDPARLNQVLINLTGNAVKFTDEGSVTIQCALLEKNGENAKVRFSVIDTGIGIAPERVEKVFESFSQADVSTYRKYGGTGLGLTISKELIEGMGGQIGLTSELGKGTTFYFELKLPIGSITNSHVTVAGEKLEKLDNLKILIAEDNEFNQMVAQDTLADLFPGVHVTMTDDGQKVVDAATEGGFDIVLMDLQMPVMDGLEATLAIRKLEGALGSVPIIAMTASATEEAVKECFNNGMNDYISKPFVPEELQKVITQAVLKARAGEVTPAASRENSTVKILVVDDNDFNQMVAEDTLRSLFTHIEITTAIHGQEAVDKLQANMPHVVLMDVNMPVMDGHQATKFIREQLSPPFSKTPIIAMTANAEKFEIEKCRESGMNDYISKPFDPDDLKTKILTQIARKANQ